MLGPIEFIERAGIRRAWEIRENLAMRFGQSRFTRSIVNLHERIVEPPFLGQRAQTFHQYGFGLIELAETVNDCVVAQQRDMDATVSDTISGLAGDLATLANAASVLARYMSRAP